jgi:hypothetical protein
VLAGGPGGPPPSAEQLAARARELDRRYGFELPLSDLVSHQLRGGVDFSDTPVLSDRYAPVDRLVHLSVEAAEIPGLPAAGEDGGEGDRGDR